MVAGGGIPLPSGGLGGVEQGQSADNAQIAQACQTGASANRQLDCEVVAVDNSLDGYWSRRVRPLRAVVPEAAHSTSSPAG